LFDPPPPQLRQATHIKSKLAAGATSVLHTGRAKGTLLAPTIIATEISSKIKTTPAGPRKFRPENFPGISRLETRATGTTEQVVLLVVVLRAEETVHVKDGVPEKPCSGVSSSCAVPQEPFFTVSCVGEKASEKSTEAAFPVFAAVTEVQFVTITKASIDPKPVAKSYPVPAL
jgi:hypothetical protein